MRNKALLTLALAVCGAFAGCTEKDPTGPVQDYSQVSGVYHLEALSFDPQGSLPKTDLISRLAIRDRPELYLGKDGLFDALTRDQELGRPVLVEGTYSYKNGEVQLNFKKMADAEQFFLPQKVSFVFDKTAMTLSYHANTGVSLKRLRQVVPEFRTEQLPDPVVGELVVVFTLDRK